MSTSSQEIDFKELASPTAGEGLEGLARLLALRLDLNPEWTGRGPDGGRDLIVTQTITRPLKASLRWLVSCKDYADSGRSVPETDLPNPFDAKLRQYDAQGFLLVTTTIPSTNTKEVLDSLARMRTCLTDVWDEHRLREMLVQPENEDLLKVYLPASYQRIVGREGSGEDSLQRVAELFRRGMPAEYRRILIPGIPDPLPRTETGHVEDLLEKGVAVIIAGEAGTGKSGIAWALSQPRSDPSLPVLLIDARNSPADQIGERLGLRDSMISAIERVGKRRGCRVLIDQLDSVAAENVGRDFVNLALQCTQFEGVQVAVIGRRRESYEHRLLNELTANGFTEIGCENLTEDEVRSTFQRIGIIEPSEELVALGKNILNISLIASIKQADPAFVFAAVSEEVVLWEKYMRVIEESESRSPHGPTFGEQVMQESLALARQGLQSAERSIRLGSPHTPSQRSLISWRILVPEGDGTYRFYHEKLQDFLYAREAVRRRFMSSEVLREIPGYSTKNVYVWMERLYRHSNSPLRVRFLESAFADA